MKKVSLLLSVILTLLGLMSCTEDMAQTNGMLQGHIELNNIEELDGKDLGGTTVKIKGTNLSASTDKNGNFTLKEIPPQDYTMTVSHENYETQELAFTVGGGAVASITTELKYNFGIFKGAVEYSGETKEARVLLKPKEGENIELTTKRKSW